MLRPLLLFAALLPTFVFAQISNYQFSWYVTTGYSSPMETYLTGNPLAEQGEKLFSGNTTGSTAPQLTGPGFPIGFNFKYDGQWFNRFAVSTNGYLKLGTDTADFTIYQETLPGSVFASGNNEGRANVISACQVEPNGAAGAFYHVLGYETTGLPGNRKLSVYFRFLDADIQPGNTIIYQRGLSCTVELEENSNAIRLYYERVPPMPTNQWPVTYAVAVGLRGKLLNNTPQNLNLRQVAAGSQTWESSVAGTTSNATCDLNATTLPHMGLNTNSRLVYKFKDPNPGIDPPVCPEAFLLTHDGYFPGSQLGAEHIGSNTVTYDYFNPLNGLTNVPWNPTLGWSAAPDSTYWYDVYFGLDSVPTDLVLSHTTANSYQPGVLVGGATYFYRILAHNDLGTALACTGHFTVSATLTQCFGDNIPPYPSGSWQNSGSCMINKFYFNDLHYDHSPANAVVVTFPDSSPFTAHVRRGQTYKFYIAMRPGTQSICYYQGGQILRAFIDYNQNGIYDDVPNEKAFESVFTAPANVIDSFTTTIPMTAALGHTRMNFGNVVPNHDACSYGMQFYHVYILPAVGCDGLQLAETHTDVPCHGEATAEITLTATGGTPPYTYGWSDSPLTDNIRHVPSGTYQGHVTDAAGCGVSTAPYVVLQPSPYAVSIIQNGNVLQASAGTDYQWCLNGTAILGATSQTYEPSENGNYTVMATNANGCGATSSAFPWTFSGNPNGVEAMALESAAVKVFPNPGNGQFTVAFPPTVYQIKIINSIGQILQHKNVTQQTQHTFSLEDNGVYVVELSTDKQVLAKKIIVCR